jgi:hypothetical protein
MGPFLAYASMVILAYITGRYYYPIPYNLKKLLFYIGLGVLLFIFASYFKIEDIFYRLSFNTLLILIFAITVFIFFRDVLRFIARVM